ncbi:UNVERIFIED_CONTAM: hypothetical protein PYX00_004590 [Menopon gallinae]|uniref:Uncharacterized protein n=1 Tax=Menopon gallinae TaxID=328185 RepID=A0AAW2I5S1_9NEOP
MRSHNWLKIGELHEQLYYQGEEFCLCQISHHREMASENWCVWSEKGPKSNDPDGIIDRGSWGMNSG